MSKSVYLSPSTQENNKGEGKYGSEEYRMNQIADVTELILKKHALTVYRNKPSMSLSQVVSDSNSKNSDIHFAIHSNAYNKTARGCEVFCYKFGSKGEILAKKVYKNVALLTQTSDRGVKQGYNFYGTGKHMYELAYTKSTASLIEVAFHDNEKDAEWIINNIKPIGIAIAKGILDYFGIEYKDSTDNVFYRVMAGSFSNKSNAEKQVRLLKKAGFDSVIMEYEK
jgi:N-acetylmuramoyl-L-alanine amidase